MTSISIVDYRCCRIAKGFKWFHHPYGLPSSSLGVLSSSLARLTYSHGIPRESTLSSRPACGMSVGLCNDVKLVSRQSRCGGVPAKLPKWYLVGLDGDNRARISCSCSSSSWISIVWCSRAVSDDISVEDACPDTSRCGFAGPRVVTTWHDASHDVGYNRTSRYRVSRNYRYKSRPRISRARNRFSLSKHLVMFLSFQFSTLNSHLIIKCHVKIGTSYLSRKRARIREFAILFFYIEFFYIWMFRKILLK